MTVCIIDTGFGYYLLTSEDGITWKNYRKFPINFGVVSLQLKKLKPCEIIEHFNSECDTGATYLGAKRRLLNANDLPESLRREGTKILN